MSPTRRPTKEDVLSAYRRSELLTAACHVFGERGFERATMERIASLAGVAKGTIYLYYPSKQSIYDAALSSAFSDLEEITRVRLAESKDLREAIAAFITARTEYFLERRDFFRMYIGAVAAHITERKGRPSELRAMLARQTHGLEHAIGRAVADGEIRRVDPKATALAIFDLTRGLVARKLFLTQGAFDVEGHGKDVVFLVDLIWNGLERDAASQPKRKR